MNYEESLTYIHGRPRFSARRTDLHKVETLLSRLGSPHQQGKYVHVTGTNGKGSTCAMVAAALRACGYRTGLFTSPYLVRFEERFRIDGQNIAPARLAEIATRVREAEDRLEAEGHDPATEFEIVTAIGFTWFAEEHCDYVVLEVGIGGRLDCTNVIKTPACACLTAVSLDHTRVLGGTLEAIAREKAGIIKPGGHVVTGKQPPEVLEVIREACRQRGAELIEASAMPVSDVHMTCEGTDCTIDGLPLHLSLLGAHQIDNACAALAVCRVLGLPEEKIVWALGHTCWPGRLDYRPGTPPLLLDAGHNPGGMDALCQALDTIFPGVPLRVVMGMMADKATAYCVPRIAARATALYACAVEVPRAMAADQLAAIAAESTQAAAYPSVEAALDAARREAQPGELVLVCGSVYLAGSVLEILEREGQPFDGI